MFGFKEMHKFPELEIKTKGLRKDKFHIGFLTAFWIIWVPITLFAVIAAIDDFSIFWVIWLPFGIIGVILIPLTLYGINGSHVIIAEPNGIKILSNKAFFQREVFIKKDDLESVMLGRYDSDFDGESIVTLNIFKKSGWWNKRIMIAPFVHPDEKKMIYAKILSFLTENNFNFRQIRS